MLAVVVSNIATIALLLGLLAGIVVGFIEARMAIVDALAFDPYASATMPAVVWAPPRTARALPA